MRLLPVLILCLLLPLGALASGKLYKWTDGNGVTHYTDEPPPGDQYETRNITPDPDAGEPVEDEGAAEPSPEQRRAAHCEGLQRTVDGLSIPGPVRMDLDRDGEAEVLTEEQKQAQLEINQLQLRAYCSEPEPETGAQ